MIHVGMQIKISGEWHECSSSHRCLWNNLALPLNNLNVVRPPLVIPLHGNFMWCFKTCNLYPSRFWNYYHEGNKVSVKCKQKVKRGVLWCQKYPDPSIRSEVVEVGNKHSMVEVRAPNFFSAYYVLMSIADVILQPTYTLIAHVGSGLQIFFE